MVHDHCANFTTRHCLECGAKIKRETITFYDSDDEKTALTDQRYINLLPSYPS
jgi:hypothetical protein